MDRGEVNLEDLRRRLRNGALVQPNRAPEVPGRRVAGNTRGTRMPAAPTPPATPQLVRGAKGSEAQLLAAAAVALVLVACLSWLPGTSRFRAELSSAEASDRLLPLAHVRKPLQGRPVSAATAQPALAAARPQKTPIQAHSSGHPGENSVELPPVLPRAQMGHPVPSQLAVAPRVPVPGCPHGPRPRRSLRFPPLSPGLLADLRGARLVVKVTVDARGDVVATHVTASDRRFSEAFRERAVREIRTAGWSAARDRWGQATAGSVAVSFGPK